MKTFIEALDEARRILGSYAAVGRVCGVSGIAVYRWRKRGQLPRTEWTGETRYAEQIEEKTEGKAPAAILRLRKGMRVDE